MIVHQEVEVEKVLKENKFVIVYDNSTYQKYTIVKVKYNDKKKINTLEIRISTLENDLKQFETEQLNKQQKLKQSTNSINIINGIKYLGITIILYHIGKQIL